MLFVFFYFFIFCCVKICTLPRVNIKGKTHSNNDYINLEIKKKIHARKKLNYHTRAKWKIKKKDISHHTYTFKIKFNIFYFLDYYSFKDFFILSLSLYYFYSFFIFFKNVNWKKWNLFPGQMLFFNSNDFLYSLADIFTVSSFFFLFSLFSFHVFLC